MSVLTVILLMYLPAPVQPIQWELNSLELSFRTGYYGSRYTTQLLPELRANGCLHDLNSRLGLKVGCPLGIGRWIVYPRCGVSLKLLCFTSLGSSNWEVGLSDVSMGAETRVLDRLSLHLDVAIPTGSYANRLGEGFWAVTAGIGYRKEKFSLQTNLLWRGENPDGIDPGDGGVLQASYQLPKGWFLASSLSAFLPDRDGPFDLHDRFTLSWSTSAEKQYKIAPTWALDLCLAQTIWGLDTEVWTTFKVCIHRSSERSYINE